MKAIILCGGKGSRLAEETKLIPKPMVKDRKSTHRCSHYKSPKILWN